MSTVLQRRARHFYIRESGLIGRMADRAARERELTPSMRAAFCKGYLAWYREEGRAACPYPDHRKKDGRLTFSRAYRNTWGEGWEVASREYLARTGPRP